MFNPIFLERCQDLARLGNGRTSPNPMVGAVLVANGRIIGEGFHRAYGEAHAEVNAVRSVPAHLQYLIKKAALYISLEPCCIFGKTPPCTDLIIRERIPKVVISTLDQTPGVDGEGVAKLRQAGIEVIVAGREAARSDWSYIRNHFVGKKRPYVILKFAQSKDGFIGKSGEQVWISNPYTRILAHKWRSEVDAVLVGTNTALTDNPELTNRHYYGKSPLRIVLDRRLRLPANLKLFDGSVLTWVVTEKKISSPNPAVRYWQIPFDGSFPEKLLELLSLEGKSSLLVEGGRTLLQSFIDRNLWEEARVFTGSVYLDEGIPAPNFKGKIFQEFHLTDNLITIWKNTSL